MKKMNEPMSTPRSFDEAWKSIKVMNPGCSTEDAMREAVKDYPGLHAVMLEKSAPKSASQIERERTADALLDHVAAAKRAGMPLDAYMRDRGILK